MAVARDVASQINAFGAWSDWNLTGTWSHTCTGADRYLLVGIETQTSGSPTTRVLDSVTYGGVAMTEISSGAIQRGAGVQVWHHLYYLVAPATGANNIVATVSSQAVYSYGGGASYTGVSQNAPEASVTLLDSSSPAQISVTTLTDGAWLAGLFFNSGAQTLTASTNTAEFNTILAWGRMFDTNASQGTAGIKTMSVTGTITSAVGVLAVSLAPVGILTQVLASTAQATAKGLKGMSKDIATTAQVTASVLKGLSEALAVTAQATASVVRSITHAISATAQANTSLLTTIVTPVSLIATARATTNLASIAINAITLAVTAQASAGITLVKVFKRALNTTAQATAGVVKSGLIIMRTLAVTAGATIGIVKGLVLSKALTTTARAVTTILTDWGYIDKYPENDTTYTDKYPTP